MPSIDANNQVSPSWGGNESHDTKFKPQDIDKPQSIFASLDSNKNSSVEKSEAQSKIDAGFNKSLNETSIMNEIGNSYGKDVKTKAFNNGLPKTTLQSLYNKFSAKFQNITYSVLKTNDTLQAPYSSLQNQVDADVENKLQNQISQFNNSTKAEYTQIIKEAMEAAQKELAGETSENVSTESTQQQKQGATRSLLQGGNYTVVKGDNLTKIANKYGTTAQEIANLNGINLNDIIYPGDSLKIPGQVNNGESVQLEEVVISGDKSKIKTPKLDLASLASTPPTNLEVPKTQIASLNQTSDIVADDQNASSNNALTELFGTEVGNILIKNGGTPVYQDGKITAVKINGKEMTGSELNNFINNEINKPSKTESSNDSTSSNKVIVKTEESSPTSSLVETSLGERTMLDDNSSVVTYNSTIVKRGRLSLIKLSSHYATDNKTLISEQFVNSSISGVQMVSQRNYENGNPSNVETDITQYDENSLAISATKEYALAKKIKKGGSKFQSSEIRNNDGEVILSFKNGQFMNSKGKPIDINKAISILEKADKKGELKKLIQNM